MKVITPEFIKGKKVLLRLDIDVPLRQGTVDPPAGGWTVADDFRLEAGLPTVKFCLEHAQKVIILGHLGRPSGYDEKLSTKPIREWLSTKVTPNYLSKLEVLENLRFDSGEESCNREYSEKLAKLGDIVVNEAFASWRPSASTTVLPALLPHAVGLRFAREVEVLTKVRENPSRPLVVIMGGAKVEDKLPVVEAMAKTADTVLVGGKIAGEINQKTQKDSDNQKIGKSDNQIYRNSDTPSHSESFRVISNNVLVGKLNEQGTDITPETTQSWEKIILGAKMVLWNGPLGRVEDPENNQSEEVAKLIIKSGAESIVGGGDTIAYLRRLGPPVGGLEKFGYVCVGGGAMLKFLETGTLPTIKALA